MSIRYNSLQMMSDGNIRINCVPCIICGKTNHVIVSRRDMERYNDGALIQVAFPEMKAHERELLQTGICSECYDAMPSDD